MEYTGIISDWNDLPSDKKLLFGKKWAVRSEDMQGWNNTFENLPSLKQRVVLGSKEDIEILKFEEIYKNLNSYTCIKVGNYLISVDLKAEISGKGYRVDLERNSLGIIDDDSFYNNDGFALATGYLPLSEKAEELNLPLLPNPFKKEESVEELANQVFKEKTDKLPVPTSYWKNEVGNYKNFWIEGYKTALKGKQFSLEDMKKAIEMAREGKLSFKFDSEGIVYKHTPEEIIQSLSTQQLPVSFGPEYEYQTREGEWKKVLLPSEWFGTGEGDNPKRFKTITNSEGREELLGTYKY